MKIVAVILHYKDKEATKACIASLKKYEPKVHVIVIDNDKNNVGFAAGVNKGIKRALQEKADAVLLLNNDTIITEQFIPALEKQLLKDKKIGIIGPAISFEKNEKKIYDIGGFVSPLTGKTYHEEVANTKEYMLRVVPYITGAAMLIKNEVFEKIGYFDEHFFLYYEDVDFCLRAKKAGFATAVVPHVSIYHALSKTAGKLTAVAVFNQTKSAIIFGKKYFSSFPKNILHIGFLIFQSLLFVYKDPRLGKAIISAYLT